MTHRWKEHTVRSPRSASSIRSLVLPFRAIATMLGISNSYEVLLAVMMVYKYWDSITVRRLCLASLRACVCPVLSWSLAPCSARTSSSRSVPRRPCGRSKTRSSQAARTMATRTRRATTRMAAPRRASLAVSAGSSCTRTALLVAVGTHHRCRGSDGAWAAG